MRNQASASEPAEHDDGEEYVKRPAIKHLRRSTKKYARKLEVPEYDEGLEAARLEERLG